MSIFPHFKSNPTNQQRDSSNEDHRNDVCWNSHPIIKSRMPMPPTTTTTTMKAARRRKQQHIKRMLRIATITTVCTLVTSSTALLSSSSLSTRIRAHIHVHTGNSGDNDSLSCHRAQHKNIRNVALGYLRRSASVSFSFSSSLPLSSFKSRTSSSAASQQRMTSTRLNHSPEHEVDTIARYEHDVTTVLRDLRPWRYDPTIPSWFRMSQLSFTNYWGLKDWDAYTSRRRFLRFSFGIPRSRLLRRILPQLSVLVLWSALCIALDARAKVFRIQFPLTSLSLVSTFVAGLQTLRTNQGLDRLSNARTSMGCMVHTTRDTASLVSAYISPWNEVLGLRIARHLALFGWVFKSHIRDTQSKDIVRTLLNEADAEYILSERKTPVAVLGRLRQFVAYAQKQLPIGTTEHRLLENNLQKLDQIVTTAERIRATPIPPVYAGHATRLMMIYLILLPPALLGSNLDAPSTFVTVLMIGVALLGLDEMSHMFEQPYRFMPLYQLSKVSMLDVADRFCRPLPKLPETINETLHPMDSGSDDAKGAGEPTRKPTYWLVSEQDPSLPYSGKYLWASDKHNASDGPPKSVDEGNGMQ